jgi:pyruvate dehydrogenase (quinone)
MVETVDDRLAEIPAAAGVKRVYGIVGDSLNRLSATIQRQGKIESVRDQHEEIAAFAPGEFAVCAGSCGRGSLHPINGRFDCHRSHLMALGIAAQIPSAESGARYFQEAHPQDLFRRDLTSDVAIARSGPPTWRRGGRDSGNVTRQPASDAPPPKAEGLLPSRLVVLAVKSERERLVAKILGGSGCVGAHHKPLVLAGRLKAPTMHTLPGNEDVQWDNPCVEGSVGEWPQADRIRVPIITTGYNAARNQVASLGQAGMTGPIGFSSGDAMLERTEMAKGFTL